MNHVNTARHLDAVRRSSQTSPDVALQAYTQVRPYPAEEERDGFTGGLIFYLRSARHGQLMSALGLQIVSYKVTIVMTAFVATAAASVGYMWSDDPTQRNGPSRGRPGQIEASAEPRKVAYSSDTPNVHEGHSRSATPSKSMGSKIVPPSNAAHGAAKRQYRLITVIQGPPREALIESGQSECLYRLGDRVPGWGVIIAITDRSVLSIKDELFIMNNSSGPANPLRYSSSFTKPCMPATEVESNVSTSIKSREGRTRG